MTDDLSYLQHATRQIRDYCNRDHTDKSAYRRGRIVCWRRRCIFWLADRLRNWRNGK